LKSKKKREKFSLKELDSLFSEVKSEVGSASVEEITEKVREEFLRIFLKVLAVNASFFEK